MEYGVLTSATVMGCTLKLSENSVKKNATSPSLISNTNKMVRKKQIIFQIDMNM